MHASVHAREISLVCVLTYYSVRVELRAAPPATGEKPKKAVVAAPYGSMGAWAEEVLFGKRCVWLWVWACMWARVWVWVWVWVWEWV